MRDDALCPECGTTWKDHRRLGGCVEAIPEQRQLDFSRVLNGFQWREKPIAPPRDPNDIVPND